MSKFLAAAAATAGLLVLSSGAALADSNSDYGAGRHHYSGYLDRDSATAEVREEREELAAAHRRWRWAWWHGNDWEARRAAAKVREERRELWAARHNHNEEYSERSVERYDYYDAHPRYHRWWD